MIYYLAKHHTRCNGVINSRVEYTCLENKCTITLTFKAILMTYLGIHQPQIQMTRVSGSLCARPWPSRLYDKQGCFYVRLSVGCRLCLLSFESVRGGLSCKERRLAYTHFYSYSLLKRWLAPQFPGERLLETSFTRAFQTLSRLQV